MHYRIFVIVVTYKGFTWYNQCFGSLVESEVPISTIVIDNNSNDGSVEFIRERFPNVILISSGENLGFAKANNIGIKYAYDHGADFVFLLNQDAWIHPDTISKLLNTYEKNDDVGIICPINTNAEESSLDWMFATDIPGECVSDLFFGRKKESYDVTFCNAASWFLSRNCIRTVGGFDTNMFVHYGEDNNYCQRVLFHGLRIIMDTTCTICHDREYRKGVESQYRSQSFMMNDINRRIEFGNLLYDIDIDGFIKSTRRSIIKSYLKANFSQANKYKLELAFFEMVKTSRDVNRVGNFAWLDIV